ncbi:TonB-linked outer membrane protein, SusC/RagA family [Porphyromonadaceae bacterium KHP3R9]|jgi:TonB-linked SusC/RagA family outer membrane protein|nr:TonB-linked outer membrane protein, SusC/RagA family [Porphyromonadaceae bacterium KHP3R9]
MNYKQQKMRLNLKLNVPTILCAFSLFFWYMPMSSQASVFEKKEVLKNVEQDITVRGKVIDENNDPVIAASILVVRTGGGTVTDIDGNFTISVRKGDEIRISYVGYETQSIQVTSGSLTVQLEPDAQTLDEVVIVGYGTQRVRDLTGAATGVNMDEIAELPGASIIDALAGQVVGLSVTQSSGRPGSTGSFRVRQPMSFDGSSAFNQPLIVIDDVVQVDENGEPSMTVFNMLNHSDIESMTILKDASAAVYGSRASAGVILVKTKRGSVGTPKISYSAKLDFSDAVGHIKTMNAYETGVFTNRMLNQLDRINGNSNWAPYLYSESELNAMKNLNYDWLDRAWQSALSQRHSLTVDGGSEKLTYFAGINYQNQETNLGKIQDFDKWTFRTGGEITVAAGLKLSASISGYNTKQTGNNPQARISSGPWGSQSPSHDYPMLRHMPKFIPIEAEILDPVTNEMRNFYLSPWVGPHAVNTSTDANVGSGFPVWNFFANEDSKSRSYLEQNGYNANFSLNYDIPFIKGLSVRGTYAVGYDNSYNNNVGDYYQLARAGNTDREGMHLIGEHTIWNFINYGDPDGTDISRKPTITYTKNIRKSEQLNFMLMYNGTFGRHDVSATGVIERGEAEGINQQQLYRGPGRSYNGVSATAGTLSTNAQETYFRKYESGSLSYVGRANYKYDNRYLFQFVIRADASTKFAPENYWGIFPTGSAGWVISEEKFFKNSKLSNTIDFLKLRYSLGQTGKDNVDAWMWLQLYNINPTGGLGFGSIGGQPALGANIRGTANRDIKWDTSIKQNLGLDFSILSGRLSLTTDYYYDKTKDMIMQIADDEEPIYIGARLPPINYGKKDAWGWEFSLRWNDRINQSLLPSWGPIRYGIGIDYSINWNKTVLGQEPVFDYPALVQDQGSWTGYRGPGHQWGFKVWKNTSQGDGMLRTQEDIDKYWQYLTDLATAAGTTPSYLGITSKDRMFPGMIAYQDLAGDIDVENQTIAGPNGVISRDHGEDYAKLASNRRHGVNTKLSLQWGDFSWSSMISTGWGGYYALDNDVRQAINNSTIIWSQFSYVADMFDPDDNPNGKYPSMAVPSAFGERSDFWQVSSFRMYVRNMVFGYSLPKKLLQNVKIERLQFNLTGNNLWDFYNPYPGRYRNMYDGGRTDYPTLRTWTLGVNMTF